MKKIKKPETFGNYGWYLVVINGLIGISMTAAFPQFTMVVGDLSKQMNTTEEYLLLSDTIKAFAIMAGMFCSGVVYNRFGLKKTFLISLACMVIPQVIFPFLTSTTLLMPLKIIQGFSAMIFPVFILIIMEWIREAQHGIATAVFNGIFYGGAGIGATIYGLIISEFGWKASFFLGSLMTLIPGIIWILTVKEKGSGGESKEEVVCKEVAISSVVKLPEVWLLTIAFLSTIWMLQVLTVDIPLWSQYLGYDSAQSGVAMSAVTIGIFGASLISGRVSDCISSKAQNRGAARLKVMLAGPIATIAGIGIIPFLGLQSFPVFFIAVLILSFGCAWGLGAFYCILPELMKGKALKLATGFIGGTADLGMPIGPLVVGVVFGIKGMWNLAEISCVLVAALSAAGCLMMIINLKRRGSY